MAAYNRGHIATHGEIGYLIGVLIVVTELVTYLSMYLRDQAAKCLFDTASSLSRDLHKAKIVLLCILGRHLVGHLASDSVFFVANEHTHDLIVTFFAYLFLPLVDGFKRSHACHVIHQERTNTPSEEEWRK